MGTAALTERAGVRFLADGMVLLLATRCDLANLLLCCPTSLISWDQIQQHERDLAAVVKWHGLPAG